MNLWKILPFVTAAAMVMGCSQLRSDLVPTAANKCRACHDLPPGDAIHAAHVDTMNYSCGVCHPGASDSLMTVSDGHGRGVVQVQIAKTFDSAGTSYYDPVNKTCNLIYCHGNFLPGNKGLVNISDTVTGCAFCHATPPVDRMHTTHLNTMSYNCDLCHPGAGIKQLSAAAMKTHANGVVDVHIARAFDSAGVSYYDPVKQTCNLSYCHGSVIPGDSGIVNIADTVTGCGFCHDLNKLRLTAHHVDTLVQLQVFYKCGFCHPGYDLETQKTNDSLHINGRVDIAGCDQCHELRTWVGK